MLIKNTFIIAFFTIVSQGLGVIRDKLLVSIVGVGVLLDIYNASFRIPDLINSIFISLVGITVIVPFLTKSLVSNNKKELESKFTTLLIFFNFIIIATSVLVAIFMPYIIKYLFVSFGQTNLETLVLTSRLLLLQPILLGTSNLVTCFAQTEKKFLLYAIAPVFYNIGIILGILFLYVPYGVYGLVYGVILGALLHLLVSSLIFIKSKITLSISDYNFNFIKEISPVAFYRSIVFIIISIKQLVVTVFAGYIGAGIISAFTFAMSLIHMPVQFFATSFSVASFPQLSEYFEEKRYQELTKNIKNSTLNIMYISTMTVILMLLMAKFIVGLIYNGDERVLELTYALIFCIPSLNLEQYYARVLMATNKVKLITYIQIFSLLILVLSLYYFKFNNYGYLFLAYGYLVMNVVQTLSLIIYYYFNIKLKSIRN